MKKMKGRLLTVLLSIAMVFTMMPMMAQPAYAEDPAPGPDLQETYVMPDEESATYHQSTKEPIAMYWNVYAGNNESITNMMTNYHCSFTMNGKSYNCSKDADCFYLDDNDALISEPGEYSYTITFSGDKNLGYLPSEYHGKLTVVKKKDFVLSFSLPDIVPVGKPLPISGTLTDEDGNPVAGVTMRFWVTGNGFNKVDESNTVTDENGVWTYSGTELTPVDTGDYCLSNMWVEKYDLNKYNTLRFQNTRSFQAAEGTAIERFDRLEVNADEVKKTYKCSEAFDTTGLKVRGYFTDGSGEKFDEDMSDGDYTVIPRKLTGECKSVTIAYSVFGQTKTAAIPVTVNHDWDAGKVTKKATEQAEGVKTYTCTVCKATKTETIPKLKPSTPKISGTPSAKMKAGKKSMTISWNKINGAEGYDIFFSRCNRNSKAVPCKKVKSINGNKTFNWTKSGLKKGTPYKAYVKAYIYKNGKKTYVRTSPVMHAYTGGGTKKYTNAKSVTVKKAKVTLKKGKTYKIKAKVNKLKKGKRLMPKSHAPKLRYLTSNSKVATVNAKGKITAKGKGECIITAYAHNGVSKNIKVTVK